MASSYIGSDGAAVAEQYHVQDSLALHELQKQVNDNESGICQDDDCGLPIPEARLRAIPHARFCVLCQAKHDSSAKQFICRNVYVP